MPNASISIPSSLRYFAIRNFLWIPILLSITEEIPLTSGVSTNSRIILPSGIDLSILKAISPKCPAPDPQLNYRPVIGILSHPGDGASGRLSNATNASYIAASYVKFVESGGARVIPLLYNEPREVLFNKLNLVNGVLFTGGWAKDGLYYEIVQDIFKKVLEKNDAGQHFPCYAICLGFELLTMIISKDNNILERFEGHNQASTLQFVRSFDMEGTVFQRFPPQLLKKLSTDCLALQNHGYGISPETLKGNQRLSSFFNVLTTSTDEEDKVYVSTVQARKYPVTAFQWHPEQSVVAKMQLGHILPSCGWGCWAIADVYDPFNVMKNAFEWGSSMIPHSEDAIQVTQHVVNFFISEVRKSSNRPAESEVLNNLIYNYRPTYCGKEGKGYDEVYIFN